MTPGGGTIAAFGLKYQYMATVEQFLQHLRSSPELIARTALVVEPVVAGPDGADDDIVDFGFLTDGEATHHFQVKASLEPSKNPLQPAPARATLERLIKHNARSAVLYTNKPLSPDLLSGAIADADPRTLPGITSFVWPAGPGGDASVSPDRRPRITVDARPLRAVRDSIADLVREFRKQRGRSQGVITCSLLVPIMLDRVFSAASGSDPSRIEALDLLEMAAMPDSRIAKVAGGFDWGLPIAGIPNYVSTVPRLDYLSQIRHEFPSDASTTPPRIALVGHTGTGKSVIASDYCHLDAVAYEFMCWVDCRDTEFIEAQIVNHVQQLTGGSFAPDQDAAAVFTGILGRRSGPWLVVLDGVEQRSDIDQYLPSRGHGVVLVTSTNSLNWWPGAQIINVGEFTSHEAIDCFASYAGVDVDRETELLPVLEDIVQLLGYVPLAISMAGIYFRNAEGTVSELAPKYFTDLAALDDSYSVPPGFNRTAFKAIQHAVTCLGKYDAGGYGRTARMVLEMGSLLAPEQLPLNLMLPIAAELEPQMDVADAPKPVEAAPALRRGVVSALRSQSIARRIVNDQMNAGLTSETIAVHPLLHQILRVSRLATLPAGQLEMDATILMHFLRGWLGSLRINGDYFGTEQLRMHSEAVLAIVAEHEPLSSYGAQNHRVYAYTKALLEGELSTCHASRRRFDRSLELGTAAAATLASVGDEPTARSMTALVVTNMVTDLSFAEAPAEALAMITSVAWPTISAGTTNEKASIRDLSYHCAGELKTMINRTAEYRKAPALHDLRAQINAVVDQDPDPGSRPSTIEAKINQLYQADRFAELAELLPELRQNASPDAAVGLDALDIVVKMHLATVDDVLRGVDALVAIDPYGGYLTHSLIEALSTVGREALRISQTNRSSDPRLLHVLITVETRRNELTEAIRRDLTRHDLPWS